jgi:hypothetical protein
MKQVNDQYPDTDPDVVKSRIIEIRKLSAGIYLPVTKITISGQMSEIIE